MNQCACWKEWGVTLNGYTYYCQDCISKLPKEFQCAFDRLTAVSWDAKFNEYLGVWVEPDGRIYKEYSKMNNKSWWTTVRKWWWISYHDNWHGYQIANLSVRGSYRAITQHRVVYATFRDMDYNGSYTVWHLDDDPRNNHIDNLYGIFWEQQHQKNIDHKKRAYKLLEMYMKWELFWKDWLPLAF